MRSAIQKIRMKDGVEVMLLITPSLFSIAHRKGISLVLDKSDEKADIYPFYIKLIWLSALNYAEAMRVEDPDYPEVSFGYVDFVAWAAENQRAFVKMVEACIEILTDKDGDGAASDEKKN